MVSKNIKEVTKLFPEKKKPDIKRQGEAKETKTLISFTYQHCGSFEKLKEKLKEFCQKHQSEIKQTPNFAD